MRLGQDRHEIGQTVFDTLFPDAGAHLRGIAPGTPLADALAAEQEPAATDGRALVLRYPLDDPKELQRELVVKLLTSAAPGVPHARVQGVSALFYTTYKLDIDSAYRLVRKHLDKVLGGARKTVTGTLTFHYDLPVKPGEPAATTSITRYGLADGRSVLEISSRPGSGS